MGVAVFQRAAECSPFMEQFPLADDLGKAAGSQAHGQRRLVDPDAGPRPRRAFVGREELALHVTGVSTDRRATRVRERPRPMPILVNDARPEPGSARCSPPWRHRPRAPRSFGAATASAAPAWLAPGPAPGRHSRRLPVAADSSVAIDTSGDSFAVWQRDNGPLLTIEAAVRPAGGAWQPAVELSAPGEQAFDPVLAVDSRGDVVVAWTSEPGFATGDPSEVVEVALRPAPSSTWQAPVPLTTPADQAAGPAVAIDSAGGTAVVWQVRTATTLMLKGSVRSPSTGEWAPAQEVAAPIDATDPQLAGLTIDPAGNVLALWGRTNQNGAPEAVQSAERPAVTGLWQEPVDIAIPGADVTEPGSPLAIDPAGDAVVLLDDATTSALDAVLRPAATGVWQAPVVISPPGVDAAEGAVGFDPQGNATATWVVYDASHNSIVQSTARPVATGLWQPPVDLSAADDRLRRLEPGLPEPDRLLPPARQELDPVDQQPELQSGRRRHTSRVS